MFFEFPSILCAFQSITKAYGRVDPDGSRYLLGDHTGLLSLLVITHEKEKYVISHSRFHAGLTHVLLSWVSACSLNKQSVFMLILLFYHLHFVL